MQIALGCYSPNVGSEHGSSLGTDEASSPSRGLEVDTSSSFLELEFVGPAKQQSANNELRGFGGSQEVSNITSYALTAIACISS